MKKRVASFALSPQARVLLQEMALDERRSLSNMIEHLIMTEAERRNLIYQNEAVENEK